MRSLATTALVLLFIASPVCGQKKVMKARYIQSEISIDGNLEEADWSLAEPATDFIQNEPAMGELATEHTEVRLLYDDENIYIGALLFDSAGPEGIRITDLSRDFVPFETDLFLVTLDTFDNDRTGFVFATNPGGAKRDGLVFCRYSESRAPVSMSI